MDRRGSMGSTGATRWISARASRFRRSKSSTRASAARRRSPAALSGTPSDLTAALKANLGEGRLLDRKTSGVALEALANHVTGLIDANASLSGDVDGHALQGSMHVAKHDDGGWTVDNLGLSLASARLAGALAVGADSLATGDLSFSATNLDDLSPLVLTKLSGALEAKASASVADGKQSRLDRGEQRSDDHRRE